MTNYSLKVSTGFEPPKAEGITIDPKPCTWFCFRWFDDELKVTMDWRYFMLWESIEKYGINALMNKMFDRIIDETLMEPW